VSGTTTSMVSVVIPTYNRSEYLSQAIHTVLQQTYQNFEIIIIDDASTQENNNLIESFHDNRISYHKNKKRMGAPYSRNIGIKNANGEFIAFLDDDDEWEKDKLEKQLQAFNDELVGLVVCYSNDKRFGMERISKPHENLTYNDLLKSFNLSSTSSYVVRKKALDTVGGFDTNLPSAQEYDLALRIAQKYKVKTIQKVLMIQNASDSQISTNWSKKLKGIMATYSKFGKEYKKLKLKFCILNHIKFLGVLTLFFLGYFLGDKIYKIIVPMKEVYENV
jgi:glycosyltransferase involved in cell wall biosynthesis